MKLQLIGFCTIIFALLIIAGCDTEVEPLSIQNMKTYDEQYFENLRAYKESDHVISFVWYAAYAPLEGVEGYKDPASWGERIKGLPDSLDICSLWMGIPNNDPESNDYAPVAYEDMRYAQETLGTRFVAPTITRMNGVITLRDGTEYDLAANHTDEGIAVYGQYLVDQVLDSDIDGVDLDYEPEGDWLQGEEFTKLVEYVGQYFGPQGQYPDKLLIVDFYSQYPDPETDPYVDFYIRQAYTQSFTEHSAARLQSYYDQISWTAPEKFIVTENFGSWAEDGGSPFIEADGNTLTTDGSRMYSLEGMARWNPVEGQKGGFGAFYIGRSYKNNTGIPYYHIRRSIQIVNPAIR
ncbi:glycoside hydrolase family 18 [Fulvivirga maritima]|uniref:glycoside hydrolase family 18 n=1 Tax=Fulvivirga maritima TaxID=2904247 RepID=UPI001F24D112|nr:glycoside hydrolase family 18 [Fulvivirga maritima]UII27681.1 glycoside hydrolase family 18 [Fulvivirga maritima]